MLKVSQSWKNQSGSIPRQVGQFSLDWVSPICMMASRSRLRLLSNGLPNWVRISSEQKRKSSSPSLRSKEARPSEEIPPYPCAFLSRVSKSVRHFDLHEKKKNYSCPSTMAGFHWPGPRLGVIAVIIWLVVHRLSGIDPNLGDLSGRRALRALTVNSVARFITEPANLTGLERDGLRNYKRVSSIRPSVFFVLAERMPMPPDNLPTQIPPGLSLLEYLLEDWATV